MKKYILSAALIILSAQAMADLSSYDEVVNALGRSEKISRAELTGAWVGECYNRPDLVARQPGFFNGVMIKKTEPNTPSILIGTQVVKPAGPHTFGRYFYVFNIFLTKKYSESKIILDRNYYVNAYLKDKKSFMDLVASNQHHNAFYSQDPEIPQHEFLIQTFPSLVDYSLSRQIFAKYNGAIISAVVEGAIGITTACSWYEKIDNDSK